MAVENFKRTKRACYFSYSTMVSVFCLPPLLFATFRGLQAARKREDRAGTEALTVSLLIQGYLLFLGLLDPTFQKIVFWCFYGIAAMLLMIGMIRHSGSPRGCYPPSLSGHRSSSPFLWDCFGGKKLDESPLEQI